MFTRSHLHASRAFMLSVADAADAGRPDRKDCASVILFAAESATETALDAIQATRSCLPDSSAANWNVVHIHIRRNL
eukprot:1138987-Pelagomonas_calceolata.AAC.14